MLCDPKIKADFRSNTFATHIPNFLDCLGIYNARYSPSNNCYTELHSGVVANNRQIWKKVENKEEIILNGIKKLQGNGSYVFYSDLGNYLHDLGILSIQHGNVDKHNMYKITYTILGVAKLSYYFHNFERKEDIHSYFILSFANLIENKTLA